jgi:FdhD protein
MKEPHQQIAAEQEHEGNNPKEPGTAVSKGEVPQQETCGRAPVTVLWKTWKYGEDKEALSGSSTGMKLKDGDGCLSPVELEDEIAVEYALTIKLDGEEFATLVCTPTDLTDLVVGFLASEGILRSTDQIKRLTLDEDTGFAYVDMANKQAAKDAKRLVSKRFIGSCCGKSRQFYLASDVRTAKTVTSFFTITPEECFELMQRLQRGSEDFHKTGGVHNAALCTTKEVLAVRTDIGRHNALDKIYGDCLRNRIPVRDKAIAFSGRVSSEVVLKTAKIGCGLLLSKSAPTDLALKLAHDLGITVVGFIRGRRLNVYTHPERIRFEA